MDYIVGTVADCPFREEVGRPALKQGCFHPKAKVNECEDLEMMDPPEHCPLREDDITVSVRGNGDKT